MYAIKSGEKFRATPKSNALCPCCNTKVISKCGEINIWHWAHKNLEECDNWSDGETEWHLNWKKLVKKEFCEVKIGNHRADIVCLNKVIELQNSPISSIDIVEREKFYKNMIWIINGNEFEDNFIIKWMGNYCSFRWKHPKKSFWFAKKPIFIDFPNQDYLFYIRKIHHKIPCYGWGHVIDVCEFIKRNLGPILNEENKEYLK